MKKIEFSFICSKKFNELEGDDDKKRFCQDCHKDVFNLDVMSNAERKKLSDNAAKAGLSLCVSVTQRERVKARPCGEEQDIPRFVTALGNFRKDRKLSIEEARRLSELFAIAYKQFSEKP